MAILCLTYTHAVGQVVTTSPVTVTQSSSGIVITFHADAGNKGLYGLSESTPVYAHTGVNTNIGSWQHATDWNTNNAKYKMTYKSANTWTLTIPDIRSFYGITDPAEQVEQLAFVFRSGDRSKEGKTASGGNILVEVFPDNFPSSKASSYPGSTPKMGTVTNTDGSVTFCLGAPGKTNVLLVGSWNDYAIDSDQLMNYQDVDGIRYFWTTVSGIADGKDHIYYYIVDGAVQVCDPYAHLVLDPWNDKSISPTVFPDRPAYPDTEIADVPVAVYNSSYEKYDWNITDFKGVSQDNLIIYEILVRDFTGTEGKTLGDGTIAKATEKLDYIKELGVNAIELMPIMEFSGNNSWGYNPNFYFAPDKAYGTPNAYKAFIDAAHERGLAVILDVVFNQCDSQHPWYNMYSQTSAERFFNGSAPHDYSVFYDWNQNYALVHRQWCDMLDYWLTEYNVDGFRFDLVKGLGDSDSYGTTYYQDSNTYDSPSSANTDRYNATRVARMKALRDHIIQTKPNAYFINENLATAQEENEMAADGEINWANINNEACEYAMGYLSNGGLDRFYSPLNSNRTWGSTVSYAESHDEERVAYKVQQYGASGVKNNPEVQMRRLGSLAAQMLLTPGAHMIWQFEELGAEQTTKNADGSNNTAPKKVVWNYRNVPMRKGLLDTYAALCAIRTSYPYLFAKDASCKVSLSSSTARYISLSSGSSELYLLVNPAVDGNASATICPIHANTGAQVNLTQDYELIAASYNTTPSVSASGASLLGGAFAVYGKSLRSGIDDIISDTQSAPRIEVMDGVISPVGEYSSFAIHSISGISIPAGQVVAPGIYIVTVDGRSIKVAVR